MSQESAVRAGRLAAERNMADLGVLTRVSSTMVEDPVTGIPVPDVEVMYPQPGQVGRAKVQTYEAYEREVEVGGARPTIQRYRVDIPVGSCQPAVGDVWTVETATLDPGLVGRKYRVVGLLHKTASTAYRLGVEEVVDDG